MIVDQKPSGMPGEQEHHICLYRFSFHKPIKSRLVRGRLYLPLHPLRKHHKICDTTVSQTPVINLSVYPVYVSYP